MDGKRDAWTNSFTNIELKINQFKARVIGSEFSLKKHNKNFGYISKEIQKSICCSVFNLNHFAVKLPKISNEFTELKCN